MPRKSCRSCPRFARGLQLRRFWGTARLLGHGERGAGAGGSPHAEAEAGRSEAFSVLRSHLCALTGAAGHDTVPRPDAGGMGLSAWVLPPCRPERAAGDPGERSRRERAFFGGGETRVSSKSLCEGPRAPGAAGGTLQPFLFFLFSPPPLTLRTFPPPLGGKPASSGALQFLLKPDNGSPRYSGRDEAGEKARGRGLGGDRGGPFWEPDRWRGGSGWRRGRRAARGRFCSGLGELECVLCCEL